ncbi:unnamed protein product [Closterium sp. Naga37s-1]|nr:unnamed protein product [Closterium sp. Naga37s-1]
MAMAGGMVRMVNGVPVRLRPGEVAGGMLTETGGGMVARIEQLAAKLAQKEAAMAALKKEVDEMKRTMAKPTNRIPFLDRYIEEHVDRVRSEYDSEFEGMKEQVEAVRREAADAVGALKAEIARMRAAAERQAAEVAYVRATAAHTEARMNDVELAVAEGKSAREKERAERNQAGGAEVPEGKKRKRDEAVKAEGLALAAAGGCALIADRDGSDGKQDGGGMKSALSGLRAVVDGLRCRVVKQEKSNGKGGRVWELLLTLWARTAPQQDEMDLAASPASQTQLSLSSPRSASS